MYTNILCRATGAALLCAVTPCSQAHLQSSLSAQPLGLPSRAGLCLTKLFTQNLFTFPQCSSIIFGFPGGVTTKKNKFSPIWFVLTLQGKCSIQGNFFFFFCLYNHVYTVAAARTILGTPGTAGCRGTEQGDRASSAAGELGDPHLHTSLAENPLG